MTQRRIVRHANYDLAVANLAEEYEHARKIIVGAEWEISRGPETLGVIDAKVGVRRIKIFGPGFPQHDIYYTITSDRVNLLTVKPA